MIVGEEGAERASVLLCAHSVVGLCAGCHLLQTEAYLTKHLFLNYAMKPSNAQSLLSRI